MSITLSKGTILNALQGKRVYQPIWQVICINEPPDSAMQMLLSDGQYVTYSVLLHPYCQITYNKTQWKIQNSKSSPEKVLTNHKYPVFKVMESELRPGDRAKVLLLSRIKLMGWSRDNDKVPELLLRPRVEMVTGEAEVRWRLRDLLPQFDPYGPRIDFGNSSGYNSDDSESLDIASMSRKMSLSIDNGMKPMKLYSDYDLSHGNLSFLGPKGLDVLRICEDCRLLAYQTESRTASFTPPTKNLAQNLSQMKLVSSQDKLEFCVCNDDKEQFRKEFQSKCMVVNQEQGDNGAAGKVQCILISKGQQEEKEAISRALEPPAQPAGSMCSYHKSKQAAAALAKTMDHKKSNVMSTKNADSKSHSVLPVHTPREVVFSRTPAVCERCGVEENHMASCRQCVKVFYCSPSCKRADVKDHATVCRAFITVRRYQEEKAEFAAKLREPEDGCATCGFWRESIEKCSTCREIGFCGSRCREKATDKHKPVCEAFQLIKSYQQRVSIARSLDID